MRTSDFTRTPRLGQAQALVVTSAATSARGRSGLIWQRRFTSAGVRGVMAFFATPQAASAFLDQVVPQGADSLPDGGFAHLYRAHPQGYSNGVWRAEADEMAHVERFTPLQRELDRQVEAPLVAAGGRIGGWKTMLKRRGRRAVLSQSVPSDPPSLAAAGAMFVGATRYTSPLSWLVLGRTWYPMVSTMKRLPGYRWHAVYYDPPFTLGTLAYFATADDLLAFSRLPSHRHLMQWITRNRRWGTGGYIRIHEREVPQ